MISFLPLPPFSERKRGLKPTLEGEGKKHVKAVYSPEKKKKERMMTEQVPFFLVCSGFYVTMKKKKLIIMFGIEVKTCGHQPLSIFAQEVPYVGAGDPAT